MTDQIREQALTAALDEIWWLRQALAYEAEILAAHLAYRTFPKSRRRYAAEQLTRMAFAAGGHAAAAYAACDPRALRSALQRAGAPTLTFDQFLTETGIGGS